MWKAKSQQMFHLFNSSSDAGSITAGCSILHNVFVFWKIDNYQMIQNIHRD